MEQTRQQERVVQAYVSPECNVIRFGDTDAIRTSGDIPVKWEWEWGPDRAF